MTDLVETVTDLQWAATMHRSCRRSQHCRTWRGRDREHWSTLPIETLPPRLPLTGRMAEETNWTDHHDSLGPASLIPHTPDNTQVYTDTQECSYIRYNYTLQLKIIAILTENICSSHLKKTQRSTGQGWSHHPLVTGICGANPGWLNQDNHLNDGEAERTDGPEDTNCPCTPNKLCLIETRKVGDGGWRWHD